MLFQDRILRHPELPSSENYEKINREITNLKKNERPQSH